MGKNNRPFPDVNVPMDEGKQKDWAKAWMDYAVNSHTSREQLKHKITRLFDEYNGIHDPQKIKYATHLYGRKQKHNFVSYRAARNKIDRLVGEFLKMPLSTTVWSVNEDVVAERYNKMLDRETMAALGPEIEQMRGVGVPVYPGMDIPKMEDVKKEMPAKSQNEIYMQYLINNMVKKTDIKYKFSQAFLNAVLASETHIFNEDQADGHLRDTVIDPRAMVFEEVEHDYFLEQTPYKGHIQRMFVHDVIARWGERVPTHIRNDLQSYIGSGNQTVGNYTQRNYYFDDADTLAMDVMYLEWKGMRPYHIKKIKTKFGNTLEKDLAPEYYEKHKKKIDKDVKNGKYEIETRYYEDLWRGYYLVGPNIMVHHERCPYQVRSQSNPSQVKYNYTNLVINSVNGLRISVQEMVGNLSFLYDITMHQINRELAKSPGKIVTYDKAFLPAKTTLTDVMFGMMNDGVYIYNSAQDGRPNALIQGVEGHIKMIDLSLSAGLQQLILLKNDLMATIDKITGINDARSGEVSASAKVTNTEYNLSMSQNVTESLFFAMRLFCEKHFNLTLNKMKMVMPEKQEDVLEMMIGKEGVEFFRMTEDLSNDDFMCYLADGRKEMETRQDIKYWTEFALNGKQITIADALEANMEETTREAWEVFKHGVEKLQEIQQQQAGANERIAQIKIEGERAKETEDRDSWQAHEQNMAILEDQLEDNRGATETEDKAYLESVKNMNKPTPNGDRPPQRRDR